MPDCPRGQWQHRARMEICRRLPRVGGAGLSALERFCASMRAAPRRGSTTRLLIAWKGYRDVRRSAPGRQGSWTGSSTSDFAGHGSELDLPCTGRSPSGCRAGGLLSQHRQRDPRRWLAGGAGPSPRRAGGRPGGRHGFVREPALRRPDSRCGCCGPGATRRSPTRTLRTNAFMLSGGDPGPAVARVARKRAAWELESGNAGPHASDRGAGLSALVVGRDGRGYAADALARQPRRSASVEQHEPPGGRQPHAPLRRGSGARSRRSWLGWPGGVSSGVAGACGDGRCRSVTHCRTALRRSRNDSRNPSSWSSAAAGGSVRAGRLAAPRQPATRPRRAARSWESTRSPATTIASVTSARAAALVFAARRSGAGDSPGRSQTSGVDRPSDGQTWPTECTPTASSASAVGPARLAQAQRQGPDPRSTPESPRRGRRLAPRRRA